MSRHKPEPPPPDAPELPSPFEQWLLGLVLLTGLVNGLTSPLILPVFLLSALWYPPLLPVDAQAALAMSSLLVSTLTLAVGGVPAALFERATGRRRSDAVSIALWLAGTVATAGLIFVALR